MAMTISISRKVSKSLTIYHSTKSGKALGVTTTMTTLKIKIIGKVTKKTKSKKKRYNLAIESRKTLIFPMKILRKSIPN